MTEGAEKNEEQQVAVARAYFETAQQRDEALQALHVLADRVAVLAAHGRAPAINELELIRAVEVLDKAKVKP